MTMHTSIFGNSTFLNFTEGHLTDMFESRPTRSPKERFI